MASITLNHFPGARPRHTLFFDDPNKPIRDEELECAGAKDIGATVSQGDASHPSGPVQVEIEQEFQRKLSKLGKEEHKCLNLE